MSAAESADCKRWANADRSCSAVRTRALGAAREMASLRHNFYGRRQIIPQPTPDLRHLSAVAPAACSSKLSCNTTKIFLRKYTTLQKNACVGNLITHRRRKHIDAIATISPLAVFIDKVLPKELFFL